MIPCFRPKGWVWIQGFLCSMVMTLWMGAGRYYTRDELVGTIPGTGMLFFFHLHQGGGIIIKRVSVTPVIGSCQRGTRPSVMVVLVWCHQPHPLSLSCYGNPAPGLLSYWLPAAVASCYVKTVRMQEIVLGDVLVKERRQSEQFWPPIYLPCLCRTLDCRLYLCVWNERAGFSLC